MDIKAVIFDMDGVICDTNPFHSLAFKSFFDKRGIESSDEAFKLHMFGKSNSYILSHFLGRKIEGEEFFAMENEKEDLFREIYKENIQAINGFMSFLNKLKSQNILTAVATSAPRANLDLIMNGLGFESQMESIMASENVTKHKPDPEVYLQSAINLGVKPKECIVFEDSFSGITAGLNAGMQVVAVLSSHSKEELPPCSYYITDYNNLQWPIL